MRSGLEISDVFIRRGPQKNISLPSNARIYELEPDAFKAIQSTETSQGVVGLVRPPMFSMDRIVRAPNPLIVVLARLQDPGNVGTILRICESFFSTGCVALSGTAGVY